MKLLAVLGLVLAAAQPARPPAVPPMPYVDTGACPFECCRYGDWTATTAHEAFTSNDVYGGERKSAFKIAPGEQVTAMSGVVVISKAGVVRIVKPTTLEVHSRRFPRGPVDRLKLTAGDRLYLLTALGEGAMSAWFNGRVLDEVDATLFAEAAYCSKMKGGCPGILERRPESRWWIKARNNRGTIGWVLAPDSGLGFDGADSCS